MPDGVENAKRALRAEIRERRNALSDQARAAAADGIRLQLDALVDRLGVRSMSCYLSTPTEPGTREFVRAAVRRGIRVLLPVMRADGLLDWAPADSRVEEGPHGIDEPVAGLLGPMALDAVDLLVIPAAAVDGGGMRIGWGRGYFDKTIGSMHRCPPVYAVLYDSEVVESVPREVHDQPVTGVVTPTRTVDLAPVRR